MIVTAPTTQRCITTIFFEIGNQTLIEKGDSFWGEELKCPFVTLSLLIILHKGGNKKYALIINRVIQGSVGLEDLQWDIRSCKHSPIQHLYYYKKNSRTTAWLQSEITRFHSLVFLVNSLSYIAKPAKKG